MGLLIGWFRRAFADPEATLLAALLVAAFVLLWLFGDLLAPVIASVIVAYLLEGMVAFLTRSGVPRLAAVIAVFLIFLGVLLALFLLLVPLLMGQVAQLVQQLPFILAATQDLILTLPETYPELIEEHQVRDAVERLRAEVVAFTQALLVYSVAWLPAVVTLATYLVLMPFLVFFFLKDKDAILAWFLAFLPPHRPLLDRFWGEVSAKVGGYVRGKAYQIMIVGIVSYVVFLALDLQFAALLAAATGLSVLIPYIGAMAAALPIVLVAHSQWGIDSSQFLSVAIAYSVLQLLDGYVLAPLLLGGAVNLHPNAAVLAILVFGGLWGFWGIFFAIPLASVVQAILATWPVMRSRGVAEG